MSAGEVIGSNEFTGLARPLFEAYIIAQVCFRQAAKFS